jgi:6-phosphogluconolactonase (cycloisomerase 2 family)
VFVQTDNSGGNAVVVYDRAADGSLTPAGTYPTGGYGGQLGGSVVDHTASQSALSFDAATRELYAVNAGSNTITAFHVDGDRLDDRTVTPSFGSFPVSVTAHDGVVYVLNAHGGGSIQGFYSLGGHLLPVPLTHRGLGLDPTQTPEFTSTAGEVAFTPGGRQLLVTTKNGANTIEVFNVGFFGRITSAPTVTTLAGTVPFGVSLDAARDVAVAEAGTDSVATFSLSPCGTLTQVSDIATGQMATCCITAVGNTPYAANAGSGTLSEVSAAAGSACRGLGTVSDGAGAVDVTVTPDGRLVYAQGGAAGTVNEYSVGVNGALTSIGQVTVPDSVGGEGIVAR